MMEGLEIFTYLLYISEMYFDVFIMQSIFPAKYRRTWTYILVVFILFVPIRMFTDRFWGTGSVISLILLNAYYLGYHVLPFRGSLWKRIGLTLLMFFVEMVGELSAQAICTSFGMEWLTTEHFYAAILAYSIYNTLMMFVVWILFIGKKWIKRISLFLIFPFYQIFNLILYLILRNAPAWNHVVVGFFVTFINIWLINIVIHVFQGMMKRIEAEEHLDMLQRQRQYELQYYRNVEHRIEELRDIRHDYLNQIQTSLLLLEAGECEGILESQQNLAELVKQSKEKLESYHQGVWCKNPVVDALLSLKKTEALRKGIRFEAECALEKELPLDNIELCCVFGNLLDNALEANPGKPEFEGDTDTLSQADDSAGSGGVPERYIRIKAQKLGGRLVVKCENSSMQPPKEERGRWVSRKKNREEHGRGLHAIEQICKKYDGCVEKMYKEKTVLVTVVI